MIAKFSKTTLAETLLGGSDQKQTNGNKAAWS
jgi:hypothetical protein